eukprot:GHVR01007348.1.p2 GENE.GHVR01007348.1~~GHVR01007348.1.p2  ORF type:complete len:368 (+),score=62.38 GHVR01007348.1:1204-2307(+)
MASKSAANKQAKAQIDAAQTQGDAAIEVAEIQSDASTQSAMLMLQGALESAGIIGGATAYGANLQFKASERSLAEQQRQYDNTTELLRPYVETGEQFLEEVNNASTLEGFAERLGKIMDGETFASLVNTRQDAAAGALAQAGLSRSGAAAQSAADITTEVATSIEGQDFARNSQQVNLGQAAAARQGMVNQGFADAVSGINMTTAGNVAHNALQGAISQGGIMSQGYNNAAQAMQQGAYYQGQGIMGQANAQAQGMIGSANAYAQYKNQMWNNGLAAGQSIANMVFYSDERLKENMQPIGEINGLTLYEWDWVEGVQDLIGTEMTTGFKAQDVEARYPSCVLAAGNHKVIDYPRLHQHLAQDLQEAA